ncbi:hypothetical protein PQO03_18125 [Lentisphaera profundi]|uniref:DUF1508 domain-containing protein n=1 Tax=Lentisphaera profundi TaxID=1658616 RepID=A0ABY7VU55_9BACT|nr:hypothetical protein [Lentisphaera profundi]WDE97746.1 hypothetical protein PQO03_18125 [Lentisphaera profundi]
MISGELKSFAIARNDKKWHWAKAVLSSDGKSVVVSSDKVSARFAVRYAYGSNPFAVRYAYGSNPSEAHFYSKDGLSTSPF